MIATRTFARPLVICALALLIVNDHLLKAAYPGLVTGKLSDFAGLVFFPLLLAAACEQLGVRRGMQTIVVAVIATGIVFAAIKLSPGAGDLYRHAVAALQWPFRAAHALLAGDAMPRLGRAHLAADPTDLVALVALAVPVVLARRVRSHAGDSTLPDVGDVVVTGFDVPRRVG